MAEQVDVAVVTGGARGIGRAISLELARRGSRVAVLDLDEDAATDTAKEITAADGTAAGLRADVVDRDQMTTVAADVADRLGPVTILVNNAGTWITKPFVDTGPTDWQREINLNYFGVLNTTHAMLPQMIEQNYGRIISISSEAARVGQPTNAVYSGAKAAVNGFTRALAKEVGRYSVTVNVVALSVVRTRQSEPLIADEDVAKKIVRGYPIRRLGEPEDAAHAVAFLADRHSDWITGQIMGVNGGYVMQ
ncbi:MAG: SDR family oxidoreductase [Pseudonocardiaceae bacterium]|nr:SDR family oxidoreductase [Pseudonocardiaceae bacterium]